MNKYIPSGTRYVSKSKMFYDNDVNQLNISMIGSNFKGMKVLIILILALFINNAQGQYYHTMFWNTQSLYNPASSGISQKYYGALIGRIEWLGFMDAPVTGSAIFDMKLDALHGGVGMNYTYEKFGFTTNHDVNVNYGYHINLQHERILSIGVSGGLTRVKSDFSSLWYPPDQDPFLPDKVISTLFNFKLGLFYKSNHWEAGLSSTHTKGSAFNKYSIYWMVCSYRFDLGEDFSIKPNLLLRAYDLKNNSLSSGLLLMYKKRFWAGITHTFDSSIGLMAGIDIMGQFRLGYSFDKSTISNYGNGNHEIILALMLK